MSIFDKVDKTNRTAFEFFKSHKGIIDKLCKPLLDHLKIDGFSYMSLLPNGYGITMGNQLEVEEAYNTLLSKKGLLHPDEFKKAPLERTHYFTWSRITCPGINLPPGTGINICKKGAVNCEGFVFSKKGNLARQESVFLDNLKYLEMFGEFFKIQARKLLEMDDPRKLVWVRDANLIGYHKIDNVVTQSEIQRFLEVVRPDRLPIRSSLGKEILLTKRETECMQMICEGKSTKEISRNLNLSSRTVEKYFERIRSRSGFYLRSDLIKEFRKNYNIWS